ncbi:MAG: hypothetical protein EOP34_03780 [Rickettsiales bacterium]|nr:MAG: hypothetical protein EOP34_03780 [Rickettsiales bacterium]
MEDIEKIQRDLVVTIEKLENTCNMLIERDIKLHHLEKKSQFLFDTSNSYKKCYMGRYDRIKLTLYYIYKYVYRLLLNLYTKIFNIFRYTK